MSRKAKIAFCIILLMALNSAYFLWQIDRHEKALLGQVWLNPVPHAEWREYIDKKSRYEQQLKSIEQNNQDVLAAVRKYKKIKPDPDDILESLRYNKGYVGLPDELYLSNFKQTIFVKEQPELFKKWQDIVADFEKYKYRIPIPSNPPYQVIKQSISSLYRYMFMIDAVLLLTLVTCLFLYKEQKAP